jgi:hypothetical protein
MTERASVWSRFPVDIFSLQILHVSSKTDLVQGGGFTGVPEDIIHTPEAVRYSLASNGTIIPDHVEI